MMNLHPHATIPIALTIALLAPAASWGQYRHPRYLHARSDLRRESPRALHQQLSDRLREDLLRDYTQGQQIPTEEELTQRYGVSRVTVRRAIQTLVEQNVLLRRQGKGTRQVTNIPGWSSDSSPGS